MEHLDKQGCPAGSLKRSQKSKQRGRKQAVSTTVYCKDPEQKELFSPHPKQSFGFVCLKGCAF